MLNLMIDVHLAMIWIEQSLHHLFPYILASQCSHQQIPFHFPLLTREDSYMRRDERLGRKFYFSCRCERPPGCWRLLSEKFEMACPGSTLKSYLSCFIPQSSLRTPYRGYSGWFRTTGSASAHTDSTTRPDSSHSRRWGNMLLVTVEGWQ